MEKYSKGKKSFSQRSSGERPPRYPATCSACGRTCEVPFKPTGSKPVLCSDCFENKGDSRRDGRSVRDRSRDQIGRAEFEILNKKLDKILHLVTTTISLRFDELRKKPMLPKEEIENVINKHRENVKDKKKDDSLSDKG